MSIHNPQQTPAQQGYRMPAEWEPHEATWLAWPHDLETWPNELEQVEAAFIQIIEALHAGEKVRILVDDRQTEERVRQQLKERSVTNVLFHTIETNSLWTRDYGPIFLTQKGKKKALIHWLFNAWGGKYAFDKDKLVPAEIAKILNVEAFRADLVLEGGSIDVNGKGTLMTTEECLLNLNRNPHVNQKQTEQFLRDYLGVKKIIWLGKGIEGDDTDGHIDEVARFVAPGKIVISSDSNEGSYNQRILSENLERLKRETDQDGKPFDLIKLPAPRKIKTGKFTLPASYTNFYIGNTCVLVPKFNDEHDDQAIEIFRNLFPERKIVGISAIPLIYGQGAIHCMTQPEPADAA